MFPKYLFLCEFVVICLIIASTNGQLLTTQNIALSRSSLSSLGDVGNPLILTKYIQNGNVNTARKLARLNESEFLDVVSYAGYFTVNENYNSNLFFWFFPAEGTESLYEGDRGDNVNDQENSNKTKIEKKPVFLWLQGGPGSSSLFGLFTENGPFFVNADQTTIRKNPHSWHKKYSMLFIDNPVGTGFSFTDPDGYCRNITQVANHLYIGLKQFFQLFPWLQENEFFITGESFAGKYIPAIGNTIYERNKEQDFIINLQGLALGNAFSDPFNMLEYADFAYQTGLVDEHGRNLMKKYELLAKKYHPSVKSKNYWDQIIITFQVHSNYSNIYNILQPEALNLESYRDFIEQTHVRRAIHVGRTDFKSPRQVYYMLTPDFMTTAIHWTQNLLDQGLRIMYYSGNMDFIVAYPLSENAYRLMKWKGADKYRNADRNSLIVNSKMAGFYKVADNFVEATILNAGHMVPTDQPEAAIELIDRFVRNKL